MDDSLKARLIGAAVLVVLAVLLIPELLSGRKAVEPAVDEGSRGTRTFTIELGEGPGQATRTTTGATPAAAGAAGQVAPAAAPPREDQAVANVEPPKEPTVEPGAPRPQPTAVAAEPKAVPTAASKEQAPAQPAAKAEPAKAPMGRGWEVQVGAFGSAASARGLVKDLTAAGFPAHISPVTRGGKTLHRVRVGPVAEKATAEQLAGRLKARGLPATVVRNE